MSSPGINLDLNKTLGAVFIGNIFAAILFGITSLQAFTFFNGNTGDSRWFKYLIGSLWILDLLHLIFMTHGVYYYLVTNFCVFSAFESPTWSLLTQVITTCLSDLAVRSVFSRRIWILSGHNNILLFTMLATTFFVFAMGIAFAVRGFIDVSYLRLTMESQWILYAALGAGVIADGLITAALCLLLDHSRTGFKSTDTLVNTLMLYSINTGLLTSICATACFVTFAIWPHQFVFMGFYFALSKLYVNSLLAVLNSREALRRRSSGMTTIPQSPSSIEPLRMDFLTNISSIPNHPTEPASPDIVKHRVVSVLI